MREHLGNNLLWDFVENNGWDLAEASWILLFILFDHGSPFFLEALIVFSSPGKGFVIHFWSSFFSTVLLDSGLLICLQPVVDISLLLTNSSRSFETS